MLFFLEVTGDVGLKQSRIIQFKNVLDFTNLPAELLNGVAGELSDYMKSLTPWSENRQRSVGFSEEANHERMIGFSQKCQFEKIPLLSIKPFEMKRKNARASQQKICMGLAFVAAVQNSGELAIIEQSVKWGRDNIPNILKGVIAHYPKEAKS